MWSRAQKLARAVGLRRVLVTFFFAQRWDSFGLMRRLLWRILPTRMPIFSKQSEGNLNGYPTYHYLILYEPWPILCPLRQQRHRWF